MSTAPVPGTPFETARSDHPVCMLRGAVVRNVIIAFASVLGVTSTPSFAAEENPLAPPDLSSPRATLSSFRGACAEIHEIMRSGRKEFVKSSQSSRLSQTVFRCLDLSEVAPAQRYQTAREAVLLLKEILDRVELPRPIQIPDAKAVARAAEDDETLVWTVPGTEIVIGPVTEGPHAGDYAFTPETIERVNDFYERIRDEPYQPGSTEGFLELFVSQPGGWLPVAFVRRLPSWAHARVGGQAVWQWAGYVLSLLLGLLAFAVALRVGRSLATRWRLVSLACYTLAMSIPSLVARFLEWELVLTGPLLTVTKVGLNVVTYAAGMILVMAAANEIADLVTSRSQEQKPRLDLDDQFVRFGLRLLGIGGAVLVFLYGGQELGIPLGTMLAGAGVGGVAIALAAQDTLKNLFGSLMILLDRPYRVGERIVVKGHDGVVTEIGLRSTKLRLLTGHVTTIPNEEMARADIENIGRRPHIRRLADLRIPYDTPPDKVSRAVAIVQDVLRDHDGQSPEFPPRVFLHEFDQDAMRIRFLYWYHPADYWGACDFHEKLMLEITRRFAAEDIRFALPAVRSFLSTSEGGALPRLGD